MQIIPSDHPLVLRMGVDVEDLSTILVGRKVFSGDIALVGSVFVQATVTGALSAEVIYLAPGGELSGDVRAGRLVVAGAIRSRLVQCDELVMIDGASIDAAEVKYRTLVLPESGSLDIRGRLLRQPLVFAETRAQTDSLPPLAADLIRPPPVSHTRDRSPGFDSMLNDAVGAEPVRSAPLRAPMSLIGR